MLSTFRPTLQALGFATLLFAVPAAAASADAGPASSRSGPSVAQASPTPAAPPAAAVEFSDDELKSFASASLQVEEISSKYTPRIEGAGSKTDEEKVREQAIGEMVQAVQEEGLSVDRYNQIALAVQSDPEVARTIQTYRAERQ